MDIREYISSGILELYAAGVVTTAEKAEVEDMARQYPEVKAALDEVLDTLDAYATIHAVTPPADLKAKVLGSVKAQMASSEELEPKFREESSLGQEEAKIIPFGNSSQVKNTPTYRWLAAAAVALLVLSNVLTIYFYNNWKRAEQSLQVAVASQQQYAQNLERVQLKLNQNSETVALLKDPHTARVELNGVEKSPASKVTIYWHKPTKNVLLAVNNLPEPPKDRQYQLWALVDGNPIDAGLLDELEAFNSIQLMKNIEEAQAFAITLEPMGGSVNPTMEEMFVMGKI
ncbi:anti-sigma factor [Adhaeribacter aquaticus]|uniref:anti-sigma factor n=1 Tax=Adhaeribacter aquaticus TaxID=299567 RepID=UPI0003FAC9E9|nr:anti-sigma factor [Adhaeribacter aquaticus]